MWKFLSIALLVLIALVLGVGNYVINNYDPTATEDSWSKTLRVWYFSERNKNEERIIALTEEQAQKEGERCMSCGMCFECDNCVIYCPQDAVYRVKKDQKTMGRYVATDYTRCIGCHICADVCPTGYIDMGLGL